MHPARGGQPGGRFIGRQWWTKAKQGCLGRPLGSNTGGWADRKKPADGMPAYLIGVSAATVEEPDPGSVHLGYLV